MKEYEFEVDKIAKTSDDEACTMVFIAGPANTTNEKYAGTFRIEDADGAEGRLLVKRSLRKAVSAYEDARKDGVSVPVIVWSDDGLARPYTKQDKERFEAGK